MPGVYGLACQRPNADVSTTLAQMVTQLWHHPWYKNDGHVNEAAGVALGSVTLGYTSAAPSPAISADGSIVVVMDGEVYDYDEQRRALALAGCVFRSRNAAELFAHGYATRGKAFFVGVHGKFAAAIWDAGARTLVLVNDRFGMRPIYYAELSGRLLFASEIKALLVDSEVSRRLHVPALAQFFTYGQPLAEDTFLEGVRLLPAAGWLTYSPDNDRAVVGRYWRIEDRPAAPVASERDTLDRIATAFDRAVERTTAGTDRLGLSLSGGLDARTILAAVDPARPLKTLCMGIRGSMDHSSAEQMARLAGRTHHKVVLDESFLGQFAEHLRRMVHLTDGHYLSQCIVMPTLPVYRELGIEILLRGHAGELMHMTKAYNFSVDGEALAARDEASLENWAFRHLRAYMLEGTEDRLFRAPYRGQIEELARESLRSCLAASRGINPPAQRLWHLFISQRTRRETAQSLVKFGSLVETRLPYLDNELVDALLDAPLELKLGERIQAHILRRRFPAFLRVTNVNTGARMGAGALVRWTAKARQKVLAKLGVPGYQPYERLGLWLRRELRPLVQHVLLHPLCLERGVFEPQAVRAVVDRHLNGQRNHTFLLMALMIFELGQRAFHDGAAGSEASLRAAGELCPQP
jgi:asparagine synthase (glutamine-hydrolysing)